MPVDYRGANLYSLYCHRRCSQTVPLSAKCQLGSPVRFWRPFKSPRPPRRLAAAANFFVIAKDYSRRRNTKISFLCGLASSSKATYRLWRLFYKSHRRAHHKGPLLLRKRSRCIFTAQCKRACNSKACCQTLSDTCSLSPTRNT